jgi:hypothetical protein
VNMQLQLLVTNMLLENLKFLAVKPFIEEIKERNNVNPGTEILLSIIHENDERGFGTPYWNENLQIRFINSVMKSLRLIFFQIIILY